MANTQDTVETAARGIEEAIYSVDRTLSTRADGTNWTVADCLSNIEYQLQRIADSLEKK